VGEEEEEVGVGGMRKEAIVGVVRFLLSDRGQPFLEALEEDLIDAAEVLERTANVMVTLASGGVVPPPRATPSFSQLQVFSYCGMCSVAAECVLLP